MKDYLDITTAAEAMGKSVRHVQRMCREGDLPGAVKAGRQWRIPPSSDAKLSAGPANLPDSDELRCVREGKRRAALKRLGVIQEFRRFEKAMAGEGEGTRADAVARFCCGRDVTERSLWRWLTAYRRQGLLGLVDGRGGGRFVSEVISDEAFEHFKSLFLDQRQPSVRQCLRQVRFINDDRNMGWRLPKPDAMYRYVKDRIPLPVLILHREGLAAYEAKCAPYVQRDPESVEPGQVWVGDHSQFNCWIGYRGKWIRPWITAWEDMRSRMIVGSYLSASPNQTTIMLAMKRGIEKFGPPDSAKIDNGRDYDSEMWTGTTKQKRRALKKGYIDEPMVAGIYAMLGIGVSFAIPYNAKAKPIERFFDTLDKQFTKTVDTYCGKDTARRPDDLKDLLKEPPSSDTYDLASFGRVVGRYIEAYNNAAHTGAGMDGRSPAEVFEGRASRRVMVEGVADLLLRVWSKEIKVGKNGVRINNIYYGQYNTELLMQQGRTVRAAYDPDDMSRVDVYDAKTLRLITSAEQNKFVRYGAPGEADLREAMRAQTRAKRAVREYVDAQLTANTDLTDLTLRAMEDAAEKPKPSKRQQIIRPVRTAMDDQVREHERQRVVKAVRRASGAERMDKVLDMDFSLLKRSNKYEAVRLFDDE